MVIESNEGETESAMTVLDRQGAFSGQWLAAGEKKIAPVPAGSRTDDSLVRRITEGCRTAGADAVLVIHPSAGAIAPADSLPCGRSGPCLATCGSSARRCEPGGRGPLSRAGLRLGQPARRRSSRERRRREWTRRVLASPVTLGQQLGNGPLWSRPLDRFLPDTSPGSTRGTFLRTPPRASSWHL